MSADFTDHAPPPPPHVCQRCGTAHARPCFEPGPAPDPGPATFRVRWAETRPSYDWKRDMTVQEPLSAKEKELQDHRREQLTVQLKRAGLRLSHTDAEGFAVYVEQPKERKTRARKVATTPAPAPLPPSTLFVSSPCPHCGGTGRV